MHDATQSSISKTDTSMPDASREYSEVTGDDATMRDATSSPDVTKTDVSMEDDSFRTPEFINKNTSFGDASYKDSDYSKTDTSISDITTTLERTVIEDPTHDATPRQQNTQTDVSMLDKDSSQTAYDISMADASRLSSIHDVSMQDVGSLMSLTTRRPDSTQPSRPRPNQIRQTEVRTESLSRDLAAIKQEHSAAPRASHTNSPVKKSGLPTSFEQSLVIPNTNPPPHSESSPIQVIMDPSGPPSHYIPVWVLGNGNFWSGQPITYSQMKQQSTRYAPLLSAISHQSIGLWRANFSDLYSGNENGSDAGEVTAMRLSEANDNNSDAGDVTVNPLSEVNDAHHVISKPSGMFLSVKPSDISMRTVISNVMHMTPAHFMASAANVIFLKLVNISNNESAYPAAEAEGTMGDKTTDDEAVTDKAVDTDTSNNEVSSKAKFEGTFNPVPIKMLEGKGKRPDQHSTTGLSNIGYTLGATHEQHRKWASEPYDYKWMRTINAPEAILDKSRFVSKIKLDHMVNHGALKINDELYHIGSLEEDKVTTIEKFGRVGLPYLASRFLTAP